MIDRPTLPSERSSAFLGAAWNNAYLLLTATSLFWSGNIVVGRAIHADVPPMALSFWRWTVAACVAAPFAWRHVRRDWPTLKRSWPILLGLSLVGVSAYNALAYTGLGITTAVNAALLQSATAPIVLIWGFLLFRERPSWIQGVGVAVSLAGVVWIVAKGSPHSLRALSLNAGDGLVLAGVAVYSLYTVGLRKRPKVHPLSFLAATFVIGAACLLPAYGAELAAGRRIVAGPPAALAIAYVALLPALGAYLFYNRGVELIGSGRAGQFVHLMPVFASILAVVFLGERLHAYHLVGAAAIGLGIWIASRSKAPAP